MIPTCRGNITFAPAQVRARSAWGLCELNARIGTAEVRRVYPDFSQIARYAWLAGDRRLQEIGIKTYPLRGQGTDFKQLSDYRTGDSVRYIDWRATARLAKPIVREFQDERDQCVMFLVDCGRRLRSEDRQSVAGTTHFDQVLNAVMLLTYVALKQGDAVGAMTFGTIERQQRFFPAQKGRLALNALMGQLYDVEPTTTHSDFLAAAQDLLGRHRKRSLVILVTNFRDEDSTELADALRLLRSRHLVLLASLRERVVREMIDQPLATRRRGDRGGERAPLRTVAPRRLQPPGGARRADGRCRTAVSRRAAGQPLPRGEARWADLNGDKGQGTRQKAEGRQARQILP